MAISNTLVASGFQIPLQSTQQSKPETTAPDKPVRPVDATGDQGRQNANQAQLGQKSNELQAGRVQK